jgi:hypothetical protein
MQPSDTLYRKRSSGMIDIIRGLRATDVSILFNGAYLPYPNRVTIYDQIKIDIIEA